ncbi:zinc finger and SCAN domain-containing protein 31-like [Calliphora vicina]|uniref:zinc finger and SCAN domain-containing protein 31-like n=1 Tax=Calliphora vicina TaxID=7373 RepID=UPI00325AD277
MSLKTTDKCRLCLVETEIPKTYELFKNNDGVAFKTEVDQNDEFTNLKLYEKVEYCCGVRLHNKKQMPTRICGKCFNTVHMWFNFRQMCYNSQVFLTTQSQEVVDIDQELEDLQTIRTKLNNKKTADIIECLEADSEVGIIYEDVDDDADDNNNDDGDYLDNHFEVDGDDENDNDHQAVKNDHVTKQELDMGNCKLENMAEFIKDNGDLLEALTTDDYNEALAYLNAEDDDELEEFIDHCATKNISIRQLNAKAMTKYKPKIGKPKPKPVIKEEKSQKTIKLPKPSTFMCNICGNVYSKKPLFQHHMRMHSDVKPYQCELCDKSYRIMSDLRNHMYRHTGEKPFKCKYCDRHFMDRSSRHRHERIHTNSRPYKCNICTKSFSYSAILKNHLKLHSGEKDYICSICNKSFTLAHQLKAHMLTISHKQKEAAFEASGYKILYETAVDI